MKSQFCAIAALVVVGLSPLQARLGETKEQIAKRYGEAKPMASSFPKCEHFQYKAVTLDVEVYFFEGKSIKEKLHINQMSDSEIEDLLKNTNAQGHHWIAKVDDSRIKKKKKKGTLPKYWVRDDKKAEAYRGGDKGHYLVIEDSEKVIAAGLEDKPEI